MFDDINLSVKKEREAPKKLSIARIRLISYATLFFVCIFSIVIFLINLRFSTEAIKNQQTQVRQSLSSYNETIAKIYVLNSRLTDISTILNGRKKYTEDVSQIIDLASQGLTIKDMSVDQQNLLKINAVSGSLSDINTFLNKILDLSNSGVIQGVNLNNLQTSEGGGFLISLEIQLQQ